MDKVNREFRIKPVGFYLEDWFGAGAAGCGFGDIKFTHQIYNLSLASTSFDWLHCPISCAPMFCFSMQTYMAGNE